MSKGLLAAAGAVWLGVLLASLSPTARGEALSDDKPFADAHILLQISDADTARQSLVLDIANNLNKHYGSQDMVDIQIVAFGPGVSLLYADGNANAVRITSLLAHGVRFYGCGNTLDTIERRERRRPEILKGVEIVQTGVAYMVEQIQNGYVHVHP